MSYDLRVAVKVEGCDKYTNINDFLFRCWQMGWLDKYKEQENE